MVKDQPTGRFWTAVCDKRASLERRALATAPIQRAAMVRRGGSQSIPAVDGLASLRSELCTGGITRRSRFGLRRLRQKQGYSNSLSSMTPICERLTRDFRSLPWKAKEHFRTNRSARQPERSQPLYRAERNTCTSPAEVPLDGSISK
jgi:hypothetical protein